MDKEKRIIWILLLALFFLPAGATLIHFKIHSQISWLPYITLFDALVITVLFYFRRTAAYALFLNSIFVIIGIGFHLRFSAWSDILISLTDFLVGYVVYLLVSQKQIRQTKQE